MDEHLRLIEFNLPGTPGPMSYLAGFLWSNIMINVATPELFEKANRVFQDYKEGKITSETIDYYEEGHLHLEGIDYWIRLPDSLAYEIFDSKYPI